HGDTKTERSWRSLALPQVAVDALRSHQRLHEEAERKAGSRWHGNDYLLTTTTGTVMDLANVRHDFRALLAKVDGINPMNWTPREVQQGFVSLLPDRGVAIEEIARLAGPPARGRPKSCTAGNCGRCSRPVRRGISCLGHCPSHCHLTGLI